MVVGLDNVSCLWEINQVMCNLEEHGEALYPAAVLKLFPAESADHCCYTSWGSVFIVVAGKAGCSTLDLVKAVDIIDLVGIPC